MPIEGKSGFWASPGKKYVTIGEELAVAREVTATWIGLALLPYDVKLHASFGERQFAVDDLQVSPKSHGGEAVTTDGIRRLPITRLMRLAVETTLARVRLGPDGEPMRTAGGELRVVPYGEPMRTAGGELRVVPYAMLDGLPPIPRGGPDDAVLKYVAALYRLAHACHEPETKSVAHAFGIPPSTASKWVMKAREREFLGPAPAGSRSGEEW